MYLSYETKYISLSSWSSGAAAWRNRRQASRLWSLAGGKGVCVSGKVVLWLTYFYVRIVVPMLYLKLWNYIYRPRAARGRKEEAIN